MRKLKSRELIGLGAKVKADVPGCAIQLQAPDGLHASWLEYNYIPYHLVIQHNLSYIES